MKKNHFLIIISLFIAVLIILAQAGCKKQESGNNTPAASNDVSVEPARSQSETPAVMAEAASLEEKSQEADKAKEPAKVPPPINENTITEGRAFPALEFTSTAGHKVSLADLKGKVVLVDFWASWCGPCVRAMPDVIETYKAYHDKGFEIIGISLDRDKSQFESYIKQNKIPWQQYYDGLWWDNKIARRFGISGIPHAVIIDRNGAVFFNTDYEHDKYPPQGSALKNLIAKLCASSAG